MASYENIIVEVQGRVGLIRLNRPAALNALCDTLVKELGAQLQAFDADAAIGAIVITGSDRAFAAGADIKEMRDRTNPATMVEDFIGAGWESVLRIKKPVIAAVAGFALGGGCELAMMCDMIFAADTAKFGQPEINLGLIPGYGGTQRLTRLVGKARSLELLLTGNMVDAPAALQFGLVSHVVTQEELLSKSRSLLEIINLKSPLAVSKCIMSANAALDHTVNGYDIEATCFGDCFSTEDMKEGVTAFLEKRKPNFTGK